MTNRRWITAALRESAKAETQQKTLGKLRSGNTRPIASPKAA